MHHPNDSDEMGALCILLLLAIFILILTAKACKV